MAFENLAEKLQDAFKGMKGKGSLTESDIDKAMRGIKLALLEADVNFKVVKEFNKTVKERCLGKEVLESLTPHQQVVKIVKEELTQLMGSTNSKLTFASSGFTIYMMVGLQGTGKTTTCGKLVKHLIEKGKKPMLCACDIYRPAAVKQLEVVGQAVGAPVFKIEGCMDAGLIAEKAIEEAKVKGYNILIIDTAGRLQIDDELMEELDGLKSRIRPHEILLVVDALTGQDAVNAAEGFDGKLGVDGIIMTKMDGDSRGGAALSTKKVTGKPIKFMGVGEKFDALEPFHPERMAERILGMGDVLSLIEMAEKNFDEQEAAELERKIKKNAFTLEDFLGQMSQIKKMGGVSKILNMLPGQNSREMSNLDLEKSEKEFVQMEAIIFSMTKAERQNPSLLNASRRKRIASGCGQPVSKINSMIKRYEEAKKMMKQMSGPRGKIPKMFR